MNLERLLGNPKRRKLQRTGRYKSLKKLGVRTSAMPIASFRYRVPRSLAFRMLPDIMRLKMRDVREFTLNIPGQQSAPLIMPNRFLKLSPASLVIASDGAPNTYPFQFWNMMRLYQKAQVEYVTYRIEVTDIGYRLNASALTVPFPQAFGLYDGSLVTSAFVTASDFTTFNNGATATNDPTPALAQVKGSRWSRTAVWGNRNTIVHTHSLDLGMWYKQPFSAQRSLVSEFSNSFTNAAPVLTITSPIELDITPVLALLISPGDGNQAAADDSMRFRVTISADYHITFSQQHMVGYNAAQLAPS